MSLFRLHSCIFRDFLNHARSHVYLATCLEAILYICYDKIHNTVYLHTVQNSGITLFISTTLSGHLITICSVANAMKVF